MNEQEEGGLSERGTPMYISVAFGCLIAVKVVHSAKRKVALAPCLQDPLSAQPESNKSISNLSMCVVLAVLSYFRSVVIIKDVAYFPYRFSVDHRFFLFLCFTMHYGYILGICEVLSCT